MCGGKLPTSNSKFCPKCGSAIGGKAARAQQAAAPANLSGKAGGANATGPSPAWKTLMIAFGVVIAVILAVWILGYEESNPGSNPIATAFSYIENKLTGSNPGSTAPSYGTSSRTTQTCSDKAGFVTCGYCDLDVVLSSNPYAGKCRYCPDGTTCSGEICGELTCKNSGQAPGGGTTTPGSGNNQPSGGGVITEFTFDSRTGCPVQGSTSSRGGVDLQCSQMVPAGRCSIQSCECYYSDAHGSNARVYYRTSDGAYFPCTGDGHTSIDCRAAAQAAVNHCVPSTN